MALFCTFRFNCVSCVSACERTELWPRPLSPWHRQNHHSRILTNTDAPLSLPSPLSLSLSLTPSLSSLLNGDEPRPVIMPEWQNHKYKKFGRAKKLIKKVVILAWLTLTQFPSLKRSGLALHQSSGRLFSHEQDEQTQCNDLSFPSLLIVFSRCSPNLVFSFSLSS